MNLIDSQQHYFDKIQSAKLKELIEGSYTFYTMTPQDKTEFLIMMSLIHKDKKAEAQAIKTFQDEADARDAALADPKFQNATPEDKAKEVEIMQEENKAMEQDLTAIKKEVRKEQEVDQKEEDKTKMAALMEDLNQS